MVEIDWWSLRYDYINPQLICPICQTALVDPTTTPCGHTFCKKCIESLAETAEDLSCPIDRRAIALESFIKAPFLVTGLVNDLVVHCPHLACDFNDKRWLLPSHLDLHCDYELVECYEPCENRCERRWFAKGECCHKEVACPRNCDQTITLLDLEDHMLMCPKETWQCPHCDEPFATSDKDQHEAECLEYPIYCTGKEIGCPFTTKRGTKDATEHSQSCPLALMSPYIHQQQDKISSLERESQVLRRQLETTKRQVKKDATNLDMHILIEYDRMRADLDHAMAQNDGNMKQMMMLARENLQLSEDVGFLRNSIVSLRHQLHHQSRRFSMHMPPFTYMEGRHERHERQHEEPNVKL